MKKKVIIIYEIRLEPEAITCNGTLILTFTLGGWNYCEQTMPVKTIITFRDESTVLFFYWGIKKIKLNKSLRLG